MSINIETLHTGYFLHGLSRPDAEVRFNKREQRAHGLESIFLGAERVAVFGVNLVIDTISRLFCYFYSPYIHPASSFLYDQMDVTGKDLLEKISNHLQTVSPAILKESGCVFTEEKDLCVVLGGIEWSIGRSWIKNERCCVLKPGKNCGIHYPNGPKFFTFQVEEKTFESLQEIYKSKFTDPQKEGAS